MDDNQADGLPVHPRRAVVTGGGSGIGFAIAERLSADGASALAVDIDPAGAARLRQRGVELVVADVAEPADWQQVTRAADTRLGGLDLLVLNAAVPILEPDVVSVAYERVRRAYAVNVEGVIHGLRAGVPLMEAAGEATLCSSPALPG